MANRNVELKINLKTAGSAALRDAVVSITRDLKTQEQVLTKLKATYNDPLFIRQRAVLQLQTEKAQGKLAFAESRERARQQRPVQAIGDLFGLGGGGRIGGFLRRAGGTVAGIGDTMGGPVGGLLSKVGGSLGSAAAGPIGLAIAGGLLLAGVIKKLGVEMMHTAVELVALARPGVTDRFNLALEDMHAVIGHRLVPVVELMTKVVRGVGDVLQTVLPSAEQFRSVLAPLGEAWDQIKIALVPIAHIIRSQLLVDLKLLTTALKAFSLAIKISPGWAILGKIGEKLGGLETSVGAAARPVQFTTPEDYAKEVYKAAAASGMTPAEKTAENTGAMRVTLDNILAALGGDKKAQAKFEDPKQILGMFLNLGRANWFGLNSGGALTSLFGG